VEYVVASGREPAGQAPVRVEHVGEPAPASELRVFEREFNGSGRQLHHRIGDRHLVQSGKK
jgi:hypothetical protein